MLIGAILWIVGKRIIWWEWLAGAASAFLLSGIFHLISAHGMTVDEECWSGQIVSARNFTAWQEYYQEAIYKTETYYTGSGKDRQRHTRRVFSHWSPRTRWHQEHWVAYSNINSKYSIDKSHFNKLVKNFGEVHSVRGDRTTGEHNSRMIGGDPNDYITENRTGFIEPITETKSFENRIKASPSVFSFVKVPKTINVFDWPRSDNPWESNRVMGSAKTMINPRKWDEMNATLGFKHHVNLIVVGLEGDDASLLQYQEAKWIGGKKNDVVIAYTGNPKKPSNVKVFGWTEKDILKQNIQSYVINNGVNNKLIDFLNQEIPENYVIKDWKKFDYISIEPAQRYIYMFLFFMIFTQGLLYWYFHENNIDKTKTGW